MPKRRTAGMPRSAASRASSARVLDGELEHPGHGLNGVAHAAAMDGEQRIDRSAGESVVSLTMARTPGKRCGAAAGRSRPAASPSRAHGAPPRAARNAAQGRDQALGGVRSRLHVHAQPPVPGGRRRGRADAGNDRARARPRRAGRLHGLVAPRVDRGAAGEKDGVHARAQACQVLREGAQGSVRRRGHRPRSAPCRRRRAAASSRPSSARGMSTRAPASPPSAAATKPSARAAAGVDGGHEVDADARALERRRGARADGRDPGRAGRPARPLPGPRGASS